ncbi:unnamed protein product [Aspergillus oryzae var. brunneus]|uniref:Unnamed protein product n=2 Tax=Aspergillus oryzae TaxID=5062 RepID=A0AAN5BZZ8_ASPOZ|nr:unnamed protein product [Aspergillus oryzae]GMG47770.1 unnamed protein product [Aspergillus oryzae var. brunneus]
MEKLTRPEAESHAKRHYFIAKFKRDKLGVPLDARDHAYLTGPPIEVDGYLSKDTELYVQGKVINDHATDVASAHRVCTAKYHERFIALVAAVEDLRDIQAKDPCFLEYEYEFDMPPSSGYYSDSSDAEESGEDGDEPANFYGSDLDFQEKWRIYHLKRNKIMGLCQSLHFARGKEVKSITSP